MRIEGEMKVLVCLFHIFLPKWFCGYEPNATVFYHSPVAAETGWFISETCNYNVYSVGFFHI